MKKTCFLILILFAINTAFAQENAPSKPSPECLKVAEFNKKIAPVKQADKLISAQLIHVRGMRPVRMSEISEVKDLQNFDVYKWLMPENETSERSSETGPATALPTDRLYMEYTYVKGGKVKYMAENVHFCEFKNPYKPTRPTLKLNDKLADPKNCFKVSDFKSKLQGLPQADTITISYTLINANGDKAFTKLTSQEEIKKFNLYNWLSKGAEVSGSEDMGGSVKKIKAQPGDLVIINVDKRNGGKSTYETNQFSICKP